MKLKKLNKEVLQDIKTMAQSLPEIWKGYQVTEDHPGQFVLECNMKVPKEELPIKKDDIYSVSFDRYHILDHEAAMLKLVKKSKTEDEAKRMVAWYVSKYSKIANKYFQTNG